MHTTTQSLPPGWRLEAFGPSRLRRDCCIRITAPDGRVISYLHKPFQFACDITRQLERDIAAHEDSLKEALPPFRIARPEQVSGEQLFDAAGPPSSL